VNKDGSCMTCQAAYGAGCTSCTETECIECTSDECCPNGSKIVMKEGKPYCGTCENLTSGCETCSTTICLTCADGKVVDEFGECKSCSELYAGCSKCDSDVCKKCDEDSWILTDYGCYNPTPNVEESVSSSQSISQATTSSSSSASSSHSTSSNHQSLSIASESVLSKDKVNVGMVVGIVVGVVVVAAAAAVVIYCLVTAGPKHAKLDNSIYEEDTEFDSLSVL